MKTQVLALLLAVAHGQSDSSICRLTNYEDFIDPECKVAKKGNPEEVAFNVGNFNRISTFDKCQTAADIPGVELKIRITCLNMNAAKLEFFNQIGEDPDCLNPYPSYADLPSYVAQDGVCVKTSSETYTLFKFDQTLDPTALSTESWEIPDRYSTLSSDAVFESAAWKADNAENAASCMMQDYILFEDEGCTVPPKQPMESLQDKEYNLMLYMQHVLSTECSYFNFETMNGAKLRMYCEDEKTLVSKSYNVFNEDPLCMNAYEQSTQFRSQRARDGDCLYIAPNVYAKVKIVPFDKSFLNLDTKNWTKPTSGGVDYMPPKDGEQIFSVQAGGLSASASYGENYMTHELKFDKYFMYGIDQMDAEGQITHVCGPGAEEDLCKKSVMSQSSCCTQIISVDQATKEETSFFRCMNKAIVDHSFSFEIDGLKMSMSCTDDSMSAATYLGTGMVAAALALSMI